MTSAALILAATLGQLAEVTPLREPGADNSTPAAQAYAHRDLAALRDSSVGDLVFRAALVPGGTDALPLAITLNGVSAMPTCAYRAKDATDNSWPAWGGHGETLTKVEAGANTSSQDAPHLGRNEKLRQFAVGDYYESATGDACEIGTDDVVVEVIYRLDNSPSNRVFGLDGATTDTATMAITHYTSGRPGLALETGGVTTEVLLAASAPGQLQHMICGIDRNYANATNGARCYLNGVNSGNADMSARSGSTDNASKFALGADAAETLGTSSAIVSLILWKQAGWLPGTASNGTMLDALAADRFARFAGIREEVNGIAPTSLNTGPRCAWTGGTSGKLDCYSSAWAITGADMPPGQGSLGGVALGGGLLVHAQLAMPILQSRTLNTTWTQVGTGTVATSSTTPFVDARQAYKVVDDQAGSEEYIYQDIDITALLTGGKVNLCPWAATESGSQVFTMAITEMTGGSCTTTTTNYTATATTAWALHPSMHTVLDGDCTTARIEIKPYDIAGGVGAQGSVAAMVNVVPETQANGCMPVFVETTTAAITPTAGPLRYATPYSAALGQRQVADAGSVLLGRRVWSGHFANPFANSALHRAANGDIIVAWGWFGILPIFSGELHAYDAVHKWACRESRAHSGYAPYGVSLDFTRDLYTTWHNGNTCQSATAASGGFKAGSVATTVLGSYDNPANNNSITGVLLRDIEVYR